MKWLNCIQIGLSTDQYFRLPTVDRSGGDKEQIHHYYLSFSQIQKRERLWLGERQLTSTGPTIFFLLTLDLLDQGL